METILYRSLSPEKSVKKVTKSGLLEKKPTFGSIISNCICGSEDFSTTASPFFSFSTLNWFFLSDALTFLYGWISESIYLNFTSCYFYDKLILFNSFSGPMESTFFSSWVLSSGIWGPTS